MTLATEHAALDRRASIRPLLRIELRGLLRNRGRSLLIACAIAVPVAVMVGCGTLFRLSQIAGTPGRPQGARDEDPFVTSVVFVLGGLAFVEAALVVAAAFAVGMRRRQREIGLVASTGAPPRLILRALVTAAAATSLVGVAIGIACGVALTYAVYPYLEEWSGRAALPLSFAPADVIGAVVFGVTTSIIAAARPAYTASRLPVTVALGGRRPVRSSAAASGQLGGILFVLGTGCMAVARLCTGTMAGLVLVGGGALSLIALCLLGGWFLDRCARWAGPLPLLWRLAVRDAGRFRSRNAPVVAAITAAMSMSVMLLAIVASVEAYVAQARPGADLDQVDGGGLLYLAIAISTGTSLVVVLVVTVLSSVESGADARALAAVGARPMSLRHLTAMRACYLALLGSALAIPGGLLPTLALIGGAKSPLTFGVPWVRLAIALGSLPVAAYAAMWLLSSKIHGGGVLRPRLS